MFKFIANLIIRTLALILTAHFVSGISINNFSSGLVAIIVISLVNAFIRPLVVLLTLPINIITIGLFTFVINSGLFYFSSVLVPGFEITGVFGALAGSIIYSIISSILLTVTKS